MKWFRHKPSKEAAEALERSEALTIRNRALNRRVGKVTNELQEHRESNGFAELIESIYRDQR